MRTPADIYCEYLKESDHLGATLDSIKADFLAENLSPVREGYFLTESVNGVR